MLRCLVKAYLPLLPIHIFLCAVWNFLLHPTILIIYCQQVSSSPFLDSPISSLDLNPQQPCVRPVDLHSCGQYVPSSSAFCYRLPRSPRRTRASLSGRPWKTPREAKREDGCSVIASSLDDPPHRAGPGTLYDVAFVSSPSAVPRWPMSPLTFFALASPRKPVLLADAILPPRPQAGRCRLFANPSGTDSSSSSSSSSSVPTLVEISKDVKEKVASRVVNDLDGLLSAPLLERRLSSSSSIQEIEKKRDQVQNDLVPSTSSAMEALPSPVMVAASSLTPSRAAACPFRSIFHSFRAVSLIVLWYFCNCQFNIENKKALNLLRLPYSVSAVQSVLGIPLAVLPWILRLRDRPSILQGLNKDEKVARCWDSVLARGLVFAGLFHTILHLSAMSALSSGAVSFVAIVKSAEPVLTALLAHLFFNKRLPVLSYLTLMPIIAGVSLASVKELSFSWWAFGGSMLSNLGSSLRGLTAKQIFTKVNENGLQHRWTPQNVFAVTAIISAVMELPMTLVELQSWKKEWAKYLVRVGGGPATRHLPLARHIAQSALYYYLYNDLAMSVLNGLHPVTQAVANTVKRVTVIIVSNIVFKSRFTPLGRVGSAIAVLGTFAYSVTKHLLS